MFTRISCPSVIKDPGPQSQELAVGLRHSSEPNHCKWHLWWPLEDSKPRLPKRPLRQRQEIAAKARNCEAVGGLKADGGAEFVLA